MNNGNIIISQYFDQLSTLFKDNFGEPSSKKLPFQKESHEWLNYFYTSPIFRHIHLEYYKTDKISVLHLNTFPEPLVDLPIMGFDLIAIGNKITGLFFDYTPTVTESHSLKHCLENLHSRYNSKKRPLPDWANFFSDNFYCVTPDPKEMDAIFDYIKLCISHYLEFSRSKLQQYNLNINVQNSYCIGQQKNDKTYAALAAEIGKEDAKKFMTDFLFPCITK